MLSMMQDASLPGERELRVELESELARLRSELAAAQTWRDRLKVRWQIRVLQKRAFNGEMLRW